MKFIANSRISKRHIRKEQTKQQKGMPCITTFHDVSVLTSISYIFNPEPGVAYFMHFDRKQAKSLHSRLLQRCTEIGCAVPAPEKRTSDIAEEDMQRSSKTQRLLKHIETYLKCITK